MIFIDTGAFIARFVAKDQHRHQALQAWEDLVKSNIPYITSNFILDETITLLARRTTYQFAAETARNLYDSKILRVLRPNLTEELTALDFLEKYADQEVNFTDCVSFALMRANRIQRVFAFDRHFKLAGFQVFPGPI